MTLTEKLSLLMAEKGINQHQLGKQTGIPYSTISNWYLDPEKAENAKLKALKALSIYFNVSLDYLSNDSITDRDYGRKSVRETDMDDLSEPSLTYIRYYNKLNISCRRIADATIKALGEEQQSEQQLASAKQAVGNNVISFQHRTM